MCRTASSAKHRRANPSTIAKINSRWRDKYRFGGTRELVIQRDKEECCVCGMTRQEHGERWNRDISIDHIDGQGRYSQRKNNAIENLQTLCLICHGRKDGNLKRRIIG